MLRNLRACDARSMIRTVKSPGHPQFRVLGGWSSAPLLMGSVCVSPTVKIALKKRILFYIEDKPKFQITNFFKFSLTFVL